MTLWEFAVAVDVAKEEQRQHRMAAQQQRLRARMRG